jgi:hypothetical protein
MNKKTTPLASLGLLVGLAVAPAYGQVWGVKVKVPFKFVVANKTLPEGEYMLSSVHDEVFLQHSQGKRAAMVLTNAVVAHHKGQGSAQAEQGPGATSSRVNNEIPFELRGGFLIVMEGRIAQLKGLRFVLDTGASYSVVDRKIAEKLTLRRRPGKVFNFDKIVPVEWADFSEVQFGPIEVHKASLMVADLVNFSKFRERVDAIIGLDLLCASREMLIDYEAHKVIFHAGTSSMDTSAPRCPPFLTMDVFVQGHLLRLMVDTGMEGILLYEERLKRFPNLRLEHAKGGEHVGYLHVMSAKLPGVWLGSSESEPMIFLMKGPPGDVVGIDGYLGMQPLNAHQIEFNFETNTLAWKR